MVSRDKTRKVAFCALLIATGCAIWVLEEFLPRPLPWAKPGLANVATLLALVLLGPREAIFVAMGRVFLGAIILGRIGGASFFMSLSGATVSALVMAAIRCSRAPLSVYGVSLSGAIAHALAQLAVAAILIYSGRIIWGLIPLVTLPSIAAGLLVGFIAARLIVRLQFTANGAVN